MDFRNKYLLMTVRILFGLFFIFSGVGGFYSHATGAGIPPAMVDMTQTLWDIGLFQLIKATEIVVGLLLIIGVIPALATLILATLLVGVFVVNVRIMPSSLPLVIVLCLIEAYLGYAYWDKYKALFTR